MTATTTILGLLPLLLSRGMGSEVQRPLSVVVMFGLTFTHGNGKSGEVGKRCPE